MCSALYSESTNHSIDLITVRTVLHIHKSIHLKPENLQMHPTRAAVTKSITEKLTDAPY